MRISVLIPTIGRVSLKPIIEGILENMDPDDEIIVVGDGPVPTAREVCASIEDPRLYYFETPTQTRHMGAEQLDLAMTHATGDFMMFIGDDDQPHKDMIQLVKYRIAAWEEQHPKMSRRIHIFEIWSDVLGLLGSSLEYGMVSGQCMVVPTEGPRGSFSDELNPDHEVMGYSSDWVFLLRTIEVRGGASPVFHSGDIILRMDRHRRGSLE